jgi:transcriptional regulator with XRE-family HTH domain
MESDPIHIKIGRNLQTIRKARSLSLDQVSELTGVSKAMISQIERGDSNPTITILWKIVNGLHLSFTSLLDDEPSNVTLVRHRDLVPFQAEEGQYRSYPVMPFDQQKGFEIFTVEMDPGCVHHSDPHNKGVEEYILMTKGTLVLTIQQATYRLSEGEAIRFTADIEHTYRNDSEQMTVYQAIIYYPS